MPFPPVDPFEPFGEDDLRSAPEPTESMHKRGQRKTEVRTTVPSDAAMARAAKKDAYARDVAQAYQHLVPPIREPQQRRSLLGRVQPAQFAEVTESLAEVHERIRENPPEVMPHASYVKHRPGEYLNQGNWERGMGDTFAQQHFSPRTRRATRYAGAALIFATSMPSLAPRPQTPKIQY